MSAILAIDAGFCNMGYAVLEKGKVLHVDCFQTERTARKRGIRVADDNMERCMLHARHLWDIVAQWGIEGVVMELPSAGAQSAKAAMAMAMAPAIVVTIVEIMKIPIEFVTPLDVKRVARKDGKSVSKSDVAKAVRRRFEKAPFPPEKGNKGRLEHIYDALAAYIAAENGNLIRMLSRQ